ncbi:MAG: L,D-transpeptidase [Thermoplasmata archaeon]
MNKFLMYFLFSIAFVFSDEIKIKISDLINYDRTLEELVDPKKLDDISLVISKKHHIAYFVQGNRILKSYPVAMSYNYMNDKERQGDEGVPEGVYYITAKASGRIFFKFSPINYPNIKDAEKALENGIINKEEYRRIVEANRRRASIIPSTGAGYAIGIHGSTCKEIDCLGVGELKSDTFIIIDWTLGCIAFNNRDLDEILRYMRVWRTPIYILKEIKLEEIENIKEYLRGILQEEVK